MKKRTRKVLEKQIAGKGILLKMEITLLKFWGKRM